MNKINQRIKELEQEIADNFSLEEQHTITNRDFVSPYYEELQTELKALKFAKSEMLEVNKGWEKARDTWNKQMRDLHKSYQDKIQELIDERNELQERSEI